MWRNYSYVAVSEYSWLSYQIHMPIVLKSGSLKLLEPSGPVQEFIYLFTEMR